MEFYPKMLKGKAELKENDSDLYVFLLLINALGGEIEIKLNKSFKPSAECKNFISALLCGGLKKEECFRYNSVSRSFFADAEKIGKFSYEAAALLALSREEGKIFNTSTLNKKTKEELYILVENLESFGAKIKKSEDEICFFGVQTLYGGKADISKAPRIFGAMAAAFSRCEGKAELTGYKEDKKTKDIVNFLNSIDKEFLNMPKNIVLSGMSGCGKSTVGKVVANMLDFEFFDTDEVFVRTEGVSVSETFEKKGEAYFRKREKEIVKNLSEKKGVVISTGGGVVCDSENVEFLKKNGIIFYLKRDIESIANRVNPSGRPLFSGGKKAVYDLFEKRKKIYAECADFEVLNDKLPKDAAEEICKKYKQGVEK